LEVPWLLWIWSDPKLDGSLYKKELVRNWSSQHHPHCGWYLDYLGNYTPPRDINLQKQFEVGFMEKLMSVEVKRMEDS
jgi:hypothetical protein